MLRFIPGLFIRLGQGAEPLEGYEQDACRTWFLHFLKSPSQMGFHLAGFLSVRYVDSARSDWRNLLAIDRWPRRLFQDAQGDPEAPQRRAVSSWT